MRPYLLIILLTLPPILSVGQSRPKPVLYSASSEWQKVTFKATPRLRANPPVSPAPTRPVTGADRPDVARQTAPPSRPADVSDGRLVAPTAGVPAKTQPGLNPGAVPGQAVDPARRSDAPGREPARSERPQTSMSRLNAAQPDARRPEPVAQPTAASGTGLGNGSPDNADRAGASYRPAFTGDFVTNRNGWKVGNKGDYNYQIGVGKYNIRKRNPNTQEVAFSYVPLPAEINLNIAETFTIKVDVVADSGRIPTGGLLFGVRDSLNFCAFTMNGQGEISIIRVANGDTFSDYMPGDFFAPGVPVSRNRNRLIIRRRGNALHFYINEQEVRSSPYPVKMFSGNNIGLITSAYWTSFQKLGVILGL